MRAPWTVFFALLLPITTFGAPPEAEVDHIEKGTIHFKAGADIHLSLQEITVIGSLESSDSKQPFSIISAKSCTGCPDTERSLYIVSRDGSNLQHFVYPGRITHPKGGATVLDSRTFFGKCIPGRGDVLVVYQKDVIDKRRRHRRYKATEPSMFVIEPDSPQDLSEKLTELRSLAQLNSHQRTTLTQVRHHRCQEIKGFTRPMASKAPDLRLRHDTPDEPDEDEDTPQTTPAEVEASPADV